MILFRKKKLLVTHDSGFHADDVFACAILDLYLKQEGFGYKIIRTRNKNIIREADIVFDVGEEYDPKKNRFDHHQEGRAGKRENGILYAACGLVWKKFGPALCGDGDVADFLDKKIFQALDAVDNGQDMTRIVFEGAYPYAIPSIIGIFNPSWKEDRLSIDDEFTKAVKFAKQILVREIQQAKSYKEAEADILKAYNEAQDKKIVVLEKPYHRAEILRVLTRYSEPVYFVYPKSRFDGWKAEGVRTFFETTELRKPFPESWRAKRDDKLAKLSGVSDAVFCHDGRFVAYAISKEGAIELAKKSLKS
jgi:uncharacterized UPF0160 family protein